MKKILLMMLLIVSAWNIYGKELDSFTDISDSIKQGKSIKMVINFNNCFPKPPIDNLTIYTKAQAIMLQPNYLQFANSPLTTNNPNFPDGPILENVTYRISSDNKVTITTKIIALPDYKVKSSHITTCKLDKNSARVYN